MTSPSSPPPSDYVGSEIAIVGMATRLPGASTVDAYWTNLRDGVESLRRYTDDELEAAGVPRSRRENPNFVPVHGALDDLDAFDANFFGMSPQDAAIMDPQHRIFLECVGSSLDRAGIDPTRSTAAIGVFAGCGMNTYFQDHLATNPDLIDRLGYFHVRHAGNDKDFLSTRASYAFDLKGPSVNVQTACSTSLVAVHVASQSLLSGECDVALAGGSTIDLKERWGYLFQEGGIHAPDGHCRAFDAEAEGTVFGSGAGVVVLKRYEDAVRDGNTIHAVLRATAVNNDGAQKAGYLTPSVDGQAAAAAEALGLADVDPKTISYVECHGTGTPVGDPIELSALSQAYGPTVGGGQCAIGSVKTNIGHLDTAAGVASLIKVVEALKHRQLPPSLHFQTPNPKLGLEKSPFVVNDSLRDWSVNGAPRRAGVNSLGVGGTNAHVIVEEAPSMAPTSTPSRPQVFPLSAKTPDALNRSVSALGGHVEGEPEINLADASHTLQNGRPEYDYRRAVVASDAPSLVDRCDPETEEPVAALPRRSIGFLFSGGGAQYPGMARDLYDREPVFRSVIDQAIQFVQSEEDIDLRPLLFPSSDTEDAARTELQRPSRGLPALLAIEVAMARLWLSWGVEPDGMIGHSAGEYAAACIAEVMSLEEALRLMCVRGRLFETLPSGGMLSVPMPADDVRPLLPDALSIAAINAPSMCVVSGAADAIEAFRLELLDRDVEGTVVPIDVAGHSPMVDPILDEYRTAVERVDLQPPTRRFASNLSGTWITDDEATSAAYWTRHLRDTVRFSDGVRALLELSNPLLLEIGPGHTLSTFADVHDDRPDTLVVCPTIRHPKETAQDDEFVLQALGRVWEAGVEIDWSVLRDPDDTRRRIPLPSYPFARESHWITPGESRTSTDPLERRESVDSFFSLPSWSPSIIESETNDVEGETWLVFADDSVAPSLIDRAVQDGVNVIRVDQGWRFKQRRNGNFVVRANQDSDVERLFDELGATTGDLDRIVHAWNVTGSSAPSSLEKVGAGWKHLFALAKVLGTSGLSQRLDLVILGDHLHALPGDTTIHSEKATLFGPARVLPRELPNVEPRVLDVDESSASGVWKEITSSPQDRTVAYRRGRRYTQTYESLSVSSNDNAPMSLDSEGVYLVTGGTGGLALSLVEDVAETVPAHFVLVSRSGLPPRTEWDEILSTRSPADATAQKIRSIQQIESLGAQVTVEAADVTDRAQMRAVVKRTAKTIGPIRGAFHAAGVLDDAPIPMKSTEDVERVLAPKVTGTKVLRDVLKKQPVEQVVLFSSVSALLGLPGQVDYCAANAYLNAAAHEFTLEGLPTIAIDWSAWQDVGMAAALGDDDTDGTDIQHPVLTRWTQDNATHRFTGTLAPDQWLVDEHRLPDGTAVLPGTGYVELLTAALRQIDPSASVRIHDLTFEEPLRVDAPLDVEVLLEEGTAAGLQATISSKTADGWLDHAHGRVDVASEDATESDPVDLSTLIPEGSRFDAETGFPENYQDETMDFGPRWDVLKWMVLNGSTAWAKLELPDTFATDLDTVHTHPALLDIATAFGLPVLNNYAEHRDFYVPITYENATFVRPLPATVISRMRCSNPADRDLVSFDVTLWDDDGRLVGTIDAFSMKRVPVDVLSNTDTLSPRTRRRSSTGTPSEWAVDADHSLTVAEGREVFRRLLTTTGVPQVVVSPVDVNALQGHIDDTYGLPAPSSEDANSEAEDASSDAADAPRDEIERTVARIWESMLGIGSIGIHDDFFDIGGHSLIAVRIFSKVKNELGVDLPLSALLQAPTIAEYADLIREEKGISLSPDSGDGTATSEEEMSLALSTPSATPSQGESTFNPLVPIQPGGDRTPFFCVHGAGGNVLNFRDLAVRLGSDQPVYGLQARGVNGKFSPHETIEAMATDYLAAIRTVQSSGPYLLGGYSGGGVIAYEMAQQLLRNDEDVQLLAFLDTYYPHLSPQEPFRFTDRLRMRLNRLSEDGWTYVKKYLSKRLLVERNRFREWGIALYETMGWTMPHAFREILMVRAFHHAASQYEVEPYPGRIVLFGASDKGDFEGRIGDDLGWNEMVEGTLEIYTIPGDHDSLVHEPHISTLVESLRHELEKADVPEEAMT